MACPLPLKWVCIFTVTLGPNFVALWSNSQPKLRRQLVAELQVFVVFLSLEVLQEPVRPSAKVEVAFDRSRKTVVHKAQIGESRSHSNLFGAKTIAVVYCSGLLRFFEQRGPLYFDFFVLLALGVVALSADPHTWRFWR